MTASHIQVLRAGPVQPIGLPPTAAAMGVTNARVLHRRMLNNGQVSRNNNSLGLLGAKRCLFGSPEPGEIQNLYEEEMKRNRDRFIERYNYDILSDRFVGGEGAPKSTNPVEHQPESATEQSCIRQEEALENRLREDQNPSSKRTSSAKATTALTVTKTAIATTTTTPTPLSCSTGCGSECDTKCNLDEIQLLTITKDSCEATTATTVPTIIRKIAPHPPPQPGSLSPASPTFKDKKSCERLKPYSRQNFITEYYNVRKTVTLQSIPHEIEVSQLPTPQKAKLYVHEQQRFQNCEDI